MMRLLVIQNAITIDKLIYHYKVTTRDKLNNAAYAQSRANIQFFLKGKLAPQSLVLSF